MLGRASSLASGSARSRRPEMDRVSEPPANWDAAYSVQPPLSRALSPLATIGRAYGPGVAGTLDQGPHDQEISPDSSAGHVPAAGWPPVTRAICANDT